MSFRGSLQLLALTTLLAIAAGCQNTKLRVEDNDRLTMGGRASYEFLPGIDRRRSGTLLDLVTGRSDAGSEKPVTAKSAGIKGTISIDGEFAHVDGSDDQSIGVGKQVELGGVVIAGPADLKVDTESLRGHIAARGGVRFYDVLSLEAILGVGIDSTDVRVRGGGSDTRNEDLRAGFLIGGRGTIRPTALFDLYAQFTLNIVEPKTTMQDLQVGVDVNLTKNLSVFAGYRWWDYRKENFSQGSNIRIDLRGATTGVSLKF